MNQTATPVKASPTTGGGRRPRGRLWVALALGIASVTLSASISWLRWPVPHIHDEFSYLLASDTFCEGRVANPSHPHWEHFESIHIIQQPSYASKYPPGQGLLMALGQRISGEPIVGIWMATALAVVVFYWMLLGWLPQRWAAVGGVLLLAHPSIQLVWGQCYWGGTVGFIGGALVAGAVPRLLKRPTVRASLAMATGALVLAVTRPYEGFVFCCLIGGYMIIQWTRRGWPARPLLMRSIVLPQVAVLMFGGVLLGFYNHAVTGAALRMPYVVHEEDYGLCPLFLWDAPGESPTYRHEVISRFHHEWAMDWFYRQETLPGVVEVKSEMTHLAGVFYFPLPLAMALLFLPLWRVRGLSPVIALVALCWMASMITVWAWPHYFAAIAPLLILLAVWGLRNAEALAWSRFGGLRLGMLLLAVYLCGFATDVVAHVGAPKDKIPWKWHREAVLRQLQQRPGQHLVFVRYSEDHNTHSEWVYNRADIDNAKVVWAREMDPQRDQQLADYFDDRSIWLLRADDPHPQPEKWQNQP